MATHHFETQLSSPQPQTHHPDQPPSEVKVERQEAMKEEEPKEHEPTIVQKLSEDPVPVPVPVVQTQSHTPIVSEAVQMATKDYLATHKLSQHEAVLEPVQTQPPDVPILTEADQVAQSEEYSATHKLPEHEPVQAHQLAAEEPPNEYSATDKLSQTQSDDAPIVTEAVEAENPITDQLAQPKEYLATDKLSEHVPVIEAIQTQSDHAPTVSVAVESENPITDQVAQPKEYLATDELPGHKPVIEAIQTQSDDSPIVSEAVKTENLITDQVAQPNEYSATDKLSEDERVIEAIQTQSDGPIVTENLTTNEVAAEDQPVVDKQQTKEEDQPSVEEVSKQEQEAVEGKLEAFEKPGGDAKEPLSAVDQDQEFSIKGEVEPIEEFPVSSVVSSTDVHVETMPILSDAPAAPEVPPKTTQKQSTNLISKVKHSLVKVKKAIIGKSPSSKNISTQPKADDP